MVLTETVKLVGSIFAEMAGLRATISCVPIAKKSPRV